MIVLVLHQTTSLARKAAKISWKTICPEEMNLIAKMKMIFPLFHVFPLFISLTSEGFYP